MNMCRVLTQLGDGTSTRRNTPAIADALSFVAAVSTGGQHACALTAAGGARCWGNNGFLQASPICHKVSLLCAFLVSLLGLAL
jgi:hypothetical protein